MCGGGLPLRLVMNSTEEEQPREEGCSCGGVVRCLGRIRPKMPLDEMLPDEMPSTAVAIPIYRVPGPLPKY